MNILLVIDSLGSGGAQWQMALLAGGLAERGHQITLFTYYPSQDFNKKFLENRNVRVISIQKKFRFDLSPVLSLYRVLRSRQYDATVAFLPSPAIYLIAARGLANRPPIIVSHRRTFEGNLIPFGERIKLSAYAAAHTIVSNSQRGAEQIAAALPFLASKLRVVSNGVELARFGQNPGGSTDGQTTLLFVGRLSPEKNIHRVLDAMALIKARGGNLPKILWAGRYEAGKAGERYAVEVRDRIKKYDLSAYWHSLGERRDIPELLATTDALLLPSTFEGTPNAVCEGLAAGRPILASRVGDIEKLVKEGVTGLLFDPTKPEEIAEKIFRFMQTDSRHRTSMGKAAREFAEQTLSVNNYIDAWETCIQAAAYSRMAEG